jgi:GntR family transcriptional regulator
MALTLDRGIVQRIGAHPPVRDQIADHIRQAITTGDLNPGDRLPSEPQIATAVEADRSTVRYALTVLANEGLIVRTQGKPTVVAARPHARRMDTQRYRVELERLRAGDRPKTAAFVTDHDATWDAYTVNPIEYSDEPASEADRRYLDLPKGAKVMRRRMVKRLDGAPVQIQRSAVAAKIAKGTLLADKKVQPYPGGTLAELYDVGLIPDGAALTVSEEATARMPNTRERQLLEMTVTGPVWDIVRVFKVDGNPVEVSRVIAPTSQITLVYETDLS